MYNNESNFEKYLSEIDNFFWVNKIALISHFQDPKSTSEIDEVFQNLQLPLRDDVKKLYLWKNGISDLFSKKNGEIELFPNGIMMPLELSSSLYILDCRVNKFYGKWYFPLFTSGAGDFLLINLEIDSSDFGKIYLYSPAILMSSELMTIFDSIEALFLSVLELYKSGVYKFDQKDKTLEIDYDLEREVIIKNNPNSEFWFSNK